MSCMNIILLLIGILNFVLGVMFKKNNVVNIVWKLLLLASGVYAIYYSLYLSNILIVINR